MEELTFKQVVKHYVKKVKYALQGNKFIKWCNMLLRKMYAFLVHYIKLVFNFKYRKHFNIFKWLYKPIKYNINSRWNTKHFNKLKKKAMRMHLAHGKQYFIVPNTKTSCMIVDVNWRKNVYNKNVKKDMQMTGAQLLKMCYFMTATGTNSITYK